MKNKAEVIKEAWIAEIGEESYELANEHINSNGYYITDYVAHDYQSMDLEPIDLDMIDNGFRPKSLQGIETNNGWHGIDEVGLPNEEGGYVAGRLSSMPFVTYHQLDLEDILVLYKQGRITHWRKVDFKNPIY